MKNYYEILEVNERASKEVIEKAYKVLVKKYHPDMQSNNPKTYSDTKIKEINEAYKVLSNEFLKEQYDIEIKKQEEKKREKYRELDNQSQIKKNAEQEKVEKHKLENNQEEQKSKVGTLNSMFDLCKELYNSKPKREEFKEFTKKDIIALLITIVIVIVIGLILWFVPATKTWINELLFENPIFKWIG